MKKVSIVFLILSLTCIIFGGGLVTNTNQSAYYVRTLNRNASVGIDAVYYNPAGLTNLENGLHAYLSNQSIFQTKTVNNNNQYLNTNEFVGDVFAPVFPNAYVAYKKNELVFSAGFLPIGGGGSAEFEEGLPSFEAQVASLKAELGTDYRLDKYFEGSSIYYGGQAGVSYKLNEMVSVAVGARYVMASNHYEGYLKNIQVQSESGWIAAPTYLTGVADQFNSAAQSLQPIMDANAGSNTLSQLQSAGYLTSEQVTQLKGGLQQAGIDPSGMTAAQIQNTYNSLYEQTASQIPGVQQATSDKKVDADQNGSGITPIISVFLSPNDDLDIAMRYEMSTKLELENDTEQDDTGMFPDGAKSRADLPAMLALGAAWQMNSKFRLETSLNYFFAKDVDWDGAEDNLENEYEGGLSLEYSINDALSASAGYLYSTTAATEDYQSDLSYGLDSHTLGFGLGYKIMENLRLDIGALNTFYSEMEVESESATVKYNKTTFDVSIGMGYSF